MAGTKEGSRKAVATLKRKYGENYFINIGAVGGKSSNGGLFAFSEDPLEEEHRAKIRSEAGRRGGINSRKVKL